MALRALHLSVQSGQGIAGFAVIELADIDLLPVDKVVTRLAGRTEPPFMKVFVARNAGRGQPKIRAVQVLILNGCAFMVLNKDPGSAAQVTFAANGFNPTGTQTAYTLSQSSPTAITPTAGSWSATQTFAPYTVTLLVVPGTLATPPAAEWDLNPDTTMVPASGTVTLNPTISGGSGNVTLSNAVFDAYEGASACSGGSLNITTAAFSGAGKGAIMATIDLAQSFSHCQIVLVVVSAVNQIGPVGA